MNRVIVHIGLHKTGTTFLQKNLFPNLPNCSVVRGFHTHRALMKNLLKKHVILSDEGMAGNIWGGAFRQEFEMNIERIKMLYNDPMIVLGIRNQVAWLPSLYKQHLHQKSTDTIDDYYNAANTEKLKHEDLLLMPKIKLVKENFSDVFIYSQKTLLKRQDDFIKGFLDFIGEDPNQVVQLPKMRKENVGVKSNLQVKTLMFLNKLNKQVERIHPQFSMYHPVLRYLHLTPRDFAQSALKGIPSKKYQLDASLLEFVKSYYQEDWTNASKYVKYCDATVVAQLSHPQLTGDLVY